jgi:hypothetical protein
VIPEVQVSEAPAPALPPDPMTQTKNRLAEVAQDQAKNMAMRQAKSVIKGYLPKFLWPLLPGERGTVAGNVQNGVSKWFWGLVSSAIFSLVFFLLFAMAFVGVALIVVYALVTG